MISLIASSGPIFAVALAYCVLGETIRPFEGFILFLQLLCVIGVFWGADGSSGATPPGGLAAGATMVFFMYALQVFNTFTSAAGTISMRSMKGNHEGNVVTWYQTWCILVSSLMMMALQGSGFAVFYTFDTVSWLLLLVNGVTAVTFYIAQYKAYSY